MKRLCRFVFLAAFLFTAFVALNSCSKGKKEVKIGAILPLTGDAAQAGVNTKLGIDLAIGEINKTDGIGGKTIQVVYEDCQGQPKLAVSAMNKLTSIDKVIGVIDNSLSNVTLAIAPIANKNKTILLATGASSPKITTAGDYVFRIWNSDDLEGEVIAKYAIDSLSLNYVSILYINNDYGLGLRGVFTDKFSEFAGKIVTDESFKVGETDFKNHISKILTKSNDAIYIVGYPTECSSAIAQLERQGYKGIILGTVVMVDPIVQNALNETKYKCYYPVPKQPDESNIYVKSFYDKFLRKYNKKPPMLADVGYDAVKLFAEAIGNSNSVDPNVLKNYFYKMNTFQGASGKIKFDMNGDVRKPIKIIQVN